MKLAVHVADFARRLRGGGKVVSSFPVAGGSAKGGDERQDERNDEGKRVVLLHLDPP
jgi:hypothetical protein